MHILLVNDDGPPSHASPYVKIMVDVLKKNGHEISVIVPSTQRSWIGKAHLLPPSTYPLPNQQTPKPNEQISDLITPTYLNPLDGTVANDVPAKEDYWVLVDGTPATCTQLGLFHYEALFPHAPPLSQRPIDLVLSGPNYGRNSSVLFALSSGTIGGALEGCMCGIRAIALSFAFFTRQEPESLVREACELSGRIIVRLCKGWTPPTESASAAARTEAPDLYSINVPLVEGIAQKPAKYTWMLDYKWPGGSLYKAVDGGDGRAVAPTAGRPAFRWGPSFVDMWRLVEASPSGNDGKTVMAGLTSITPLKANLLSLYGQGPFVGDLDL